MKKNNSKIEKSKTYRTFGIVLTTLATGLCLAGIFLVAFFYLDNVKTFKVIYQLKNFIVNSERINYLLTTLFLSSIIFSFCFLVVKNVKSYRKIMNKSADYSIGFTSVLIAITTLVFGAYGKIFGLENTTFKVFFSVMESSLFLILFYQFFSAYYVQRFSGVCGKKYFVLTLVSIVIGLFSLIYVYVFLSVKNVEVKEILSIKNLLEGKPVVKLFNTATGGVEFSALKIVAVLAVFVVEFWFYVEAFRLLIVCLFGLVKLFADRKVYFNSRFFKRSSSVLSGVIFGSCPFFIELSYFILNIVFGEKFNIAFGCFSTINVVVFLGLLACWVSYNLTVKYIIAKNENKSKKKSKKENVDEDLVIGDL